MNAIEIMRQRIQDAWNLYHLHNKDEYAVQLDMLCRINDCIPEKFRLEEEEMNPTTKEQDQHLIALKSKLRKAETDWLISAA